MDTLATFNTTNYVETFRRDGYFICRDVISSSDVEDLRRAIAEIPDRDEVLRNQSVYGVRNLLQICAAVRRLAVQLCVRQFVTALIGENAFAVRATFFDKAPGANWSLFWHQDKVIAVDQRIELPSYVGWSKKVDVWHVQPPAEVLSGVISVRVQLDDSLLTNGPLRVIPGSHRVGWIENIDEWKRRKPEVTCIVPCGGVVVMCPLTLHASARSESTEHRRVIHIEYAAAELPTGLDWNVRVSPSSPLMMS
jgi:ectoine hydroxylase-related dioxygenase (phytanoyl-CoA dioxygenase family)